MEINKKRGELSMYLQHIHLINYRNYENQQLNLNRGINVLIGSNGQGKTNLLESIYYLAAGNNFRGNKDIELIKWDQPYLRLIGQMKKDDSERCYEMEVYIDKEKNKQLKINGVKYKSMSELHNYLRVVLFSPDDLKIVKGSPAERRRYLDVCMSQQDKFYYRLIRDYDRIVQQRNNLLKELQYKKENKAQLEVWNQYLIEYGSQIIYKRLQYLKMLVPMARKVQQALTCETERFSVTYHCSMGAIGDFSVEQIKNVFQTILAQKQGEEIARGTTLWGPHRDDLIFYLNGMDLKKYGSQGQQRTGILSLKMAELQTFYKLHGEYPLLLLDDVMSELDDARRQFLMKMVKKYQIQTIITGANIELLTDEMAENEIFWVQEGKIITK
ncbi:MAG: DNA replication/repair protein RecF [Peptococcaceae bacterium]|nr:DNA replication/repair protein RecF [Peptococcaceae bacterium]